METKRNNEGGEEESQPQQNQAIQHQLAEVLKRLENVEKRLTNLENTTTTVKNLTEKKLEKEAKIVSYSEFENTICDRTVYNANEIPPEERQESEIQEGDADVRQKIKEGAVHNKTMLWHARMGHASINYLKKLQQKFPETVELHETVFDDTILDCEVCIISKINEQPVKKTIVQRAAEPLEIIHFDIMGMISPVTYPKEYKYISLFTDDYSRLAMAYPMKTKDEIGLHFESFVKSAQNLLGRDAKISCLKSYQETEFTGNYMSEVLEKLDIELQIECSDNEIYNHTIQKKVRVLMYDSGLPENMWDLALGSAIFAYNRTPHSANDMKTPFQMFNPKYNTSDLTRLRRFGCLAYVKVNRKLNQKYRFIIKRLILVGYMESGYILLNPEDGKFYVTREVRFNEKMVFSNKYTRKNVKNWQSINKEVDTDTWFIEFEKEEKEQQNKNERPVNYNKRGREW